jgi:hypothetical protein
MAFVLFAAMSPMSVDAARLIVNVTDEPIPAKADGTSFSSEEIHYIITESCKEKGWSPVSKDAGIIYATLNFDNRYWAVVQLASTSTTYSINYESSTNLGYDERKQKIHRAYNNWVDQLRQTINRNFQIASYNPESVLPATSPDAPLRSDWVDTYSKLMQLDELRKNGILTEEEFTAEKRKLLQLD